MKYSEAWTELEKRIKRIAKEAKDREGSAKRRADLPSVYYNQGKNMAADEILDIIEELEWEFE